MKKHSLPKGFRHLFSKKEIRTIEEELNMGFTQILFSHCINTDKFESEKLVQSSFDPISIYVRENEDGWEFDFNQSGFRSELLPSQLESETKKLVRQSVIQYVPKIQKASETDFLKTPQLWVSVSITDDQLNVETKELK